MKYSGHLISLAALAVAKVAVGVGAIALITYAGIAAADVWREDGQLVGNVCRNGSYVTKYPSGMVLPVGSRCVLRDVSWTPVGWGVVADE